MFRNRLLWICLCAVLVSCERKVDFKLNDVTPKLVVEGIIENGRKPIVYLSKSAGYFDTLDLATLSSSFVHNAEVYISNGTVTHKLKEYVVPIGTGLTLYYYGIDSSNLGTAFIGQLKTRYDLRIVSEGQEYRATTHIPDTTKKIDSVYWKPAGGSNPSDKVMLMVKMTDKPGLGDYIRYFTQTGIDEFYPALNSVFDDQVIDGTTYEVQAEKGVDRNRVLPDDYTLFNKGDSVTFKLSTIDKGTYDFWRTMEFTYISVGNPFSSPTKVLSNVNNGALGYFGGYASQYRTIVIPR